MTMVPQPPGGSRGEAAPSPARSVVAPLAMADGNAFNLDFGAKPEGGERSAKSAKSGDGSSPRKSRLVGEKVKWAKLPGLMRKMKVVNEMKNGSSLVGANVEWQNAAEQADRLQSRIQGLREKSAGMGINMSMGIDPRLMEEVFARADELVDLAPMRKHDRKKETAKEKEAKEKEEAKARLVPTDLPLNMAPATYSQLPKRVQRRLAKEYASRDKTADEKTLGQRVAAEAQRKAAHANVIEPQVGIIPSSIGDDSTASGWSFSLVFRELFVSCSRVFVHFRSPFVGQSWSASYRSWSSLSQSSPPRYATSRPRSTRWPSTTRTGKRSQANLSLAVISRAFFPDRLLVLTGWLSSSPRARWRCFTD